MKVSVSALVSLLFATTLVSGSTLAQRRAARAARKSRPLELSSSERNGAASGNETDVTFSSNWSGVVLTSPPSGQTFTKVVGTFNVPTASGQGAASAWVGIDGDTAQSAILQSGIDFDADGSFDAWFEWFPNAATDFTGFSMSAGQSITVTIQSSSSTSGTVTLKNNSSGKSVSKSLTAPRGSTLAGQNAEWIVEDFEEGGSLVNFADFTPVTFTGAVATTNSGTQVPITNGAVFEIESENGQVLTTASILSSSSLRVSHT